MIITLFGVRGTIGKIMLIDDLEFGYRRVVGGAGLAESSPTVSPNAPISFRLRGQDAWLKS